MGENLGISKSTSGTLNSIRKSERYRQIASNLSTLASERRESATLKDTNNKIFTDALGTLGLIIGSVYSLGAGSSLGASIGTFAGGLLTNSLNSSKEDKENAELYTQMAGNIVSYLSNVTARDTTIMNTMDRIYSSMDSLRSSYGNSFVDTMYNYYLARSGMNSDAYSLLTGNFKTFDDIGYGRISSEGTVFDKLTDGNQNMFNNVYAQLQLGDITGNKSLLDSMVQALYGADTEMAIQLRSYENELRNALVNSEDQQSRLLKKAKSELFNENIEARGENISYAGSIGSAEAETASSGLRGGTTDSKANLARLQRDLRQIQRTAGVAALIGTLKYDIFNAQRNASSTAYSYRMAQKRTLNGAFNGAVSSFNSVGRNAQAGERDANYYLDEAKSHERQFNEGLGKSDEKDKDRIFYAAAK